MEENKTLSLVLPENWHFLRGDMKGWGFKCKLSNCGDRYHRHRKAPHDSKRKKEKNSHMGYSLNVRIICMCDIYIVLTFIQLLLVNPIYLAGQGGCEVEDAVTPYARRERRI